MLHRSNDKNEKNEDETRFGILAFTRDAAMYGL